MKSKKMKKLIREELEEIKTQIELIRGMILNMNYYRRHD